MPNFPGTTPEMEQVNQTIQKIIFDVALPMAFTIVETEVPFLGFPVIKQIFEFGTRKFLDVLYGQASLGVLNMVIDFKTEAERIAYDKARDELKLQLQKAEQNVEELKIAQEEFKKRLADLIRFPRPV